MGWVVNNTHRPHSPRERNKVPVLMEAERALRLFPTGMENRKSYSPRGSEPRIDQPTASHNTVCDVAAIYSTKVSSFFNIIPESIDQFFSHIGRTIKNSFAVETGFLLSQPFTKSHFHFLIIMDTTL